MKSRLLFLTAGVVVMMMNGMLSASAGGAWLYTTESHYEPGDHVVAVGYVQEGTAEAPFHAELGLVPRADLSDYGSQSWQILVGAVTIENTGLGGYLTNRVILEFEVPTNLEAGEYEIAVRNDKGELLADLIGLMLYVGYDPDFERWIEWPLDEPRIVDLAPEDVIAGPGWSVTVADLREGEYPPKAAKFMLHPETIPTIAVEEQPAETSTTTASPPTTITELPSTQTVEEQDQQVVAAPVAQLSTSEPDTSQRTALMLVLIPGLLTLTGGVVYVVHLRRRSGMSNSA